jgi:hypothetical protein
MQNCRFRGWTERIRGDRARAATPYLEDEFDGAAEAEAALRRDAGEEVRHDVLERARDSLEQLEEVRALVAPHLARGREW